MFSYYEESLILYWMTLVEQETTASKDMKEAHTLNHHLKRSVASTIVKTQYSSLLSNSSDHKLKNNTINDSSPWISYSTWT